MSFIYLEPCDAPIASTHHLAHRTPNLQGKTLALLDNGKPNAGAVLQAIGAQLRLLLDLREVIVYTKPSAYRVAPAELIDTLAANCAVFLSGVGD